MVVRPSAISVRLSRSTENYYDELLKERDRLSAREPVLRCERAGGLHQEGGQANIVAETKAKKTKLERFLVRGRLI